MQMAIGDTLVDGETIIDNVTSIINKKYFK